MKDNIEIVEYMITKSIAKVNKPLFKLSLLSIMAGALISLGSVGNLVVSADLYKTNVGLAKFAGAAVFPIGLITIVLLGYELFTSNCMGICAVYDKKVKFNKFIKNILFVLFFNFIGCLLIALITAKTHTLSESARQLLFNMAEHKVHASALDIFLKAILCNVLVCGASLIGYGSKESSGKIFGIWFVIMLFIILGYDHIVANMLYLPTAYLLNAPISVLDILYNFLFAGLGNFVGGALVIMTPLYINAKGVFECKK